MDQAYLNRINEIKRMHKKYPISYRIALLFLFVILLIGVGIAQILDFGASLFTEVVSIAITVGIIDTLNRHREKKDNDRIQRIISSNVGKSVLTNETQRAFFDLAVRDLLDGYKITHFDLVGFNCANLSFINTQFEYFNLDNTKWNDIAFVGSTINWTSMEKISLSKCNFHKIIFNYIDMSKGYITESTFCSSALIVHCKETRFNRVTFINCDLSKSCFENCYFEFCIFCETDFRGTNLLNSNFLRCQFDNQTRLPDGSYYDIETNESQLAKFINSAHPQYLEYSCSGFHYGLHVPNK